MNRDPTLCREFVKQAKVFMAAYPQINHTWSIDADEDHCILDIPEHAPEGFAITVEVHPEEIIVSFGGAHTNAGPEGNPVKFVSHVIGYVRDLLSPVMRVRELSAGGNAYRWGIELLEDGKWHSQEWVGLLFWNYFGKRSEKFYRNEILPARENPVEPCAAGDSSTRPERGSRTT